MLAIIVPYRDREEHLKQFIPHMNKYLPGVKIVIVEQADFQPFNRGKLLNVGFLESHNRDYFVFHDIDLLPIDCNYEGRMAVTQLASSSIQKDNYLGGATMFDKKIFLTIGGYHNDFWHRAEDNEMMFNLKRLKIPVVNRFGTFKQLRHPRTGPEFIPELWAKAQLPRNINMLETCKYELIFKEVYSTHTHLRVIL